MFPARLPWTVLALLSLALAGCRTYEGMFFVEHTHVGAQIKVSPETDAKPVDVNIGYDRGLLAVVPRTGAGENAGSVISKTDLDIVFTTNSTIKNVFATGAAAKNLARNGANVAALFGQCYDETPALKARKGAALARLEKAKADKDKLVALYETVFPARTYHPVTTTREELYRELRGRIAAICDSETDDKVLRLYEKL